MSDTLPTTNHRPPDPLTPDDRTQAKAMALVFFEENPHGKVRTLANRLCYSKRNTERIIAELKREGALLRTGSNQKSTWTVVQHNT